MKAEGKEGSQYVIKAKRAPKDPNAPKNPKSAYMFFATKCRADLMKKSPGMSFTEIGREAGKQWQGLSDTQKEPWEKKVSDDKERYTKEMESYVPDEAYAAQQKKMKAQGAKLAKDPDKPKRGRTAYLVFCDSKRAAVRKKYPKKSMIEVMADLAAQWKTISAKEKEECEGTANGEKAAYETALANYEPSDEYKAAMDIIASMKKTKKSKGKKKKAKAKKKTKKKKGKAKKNKGKVKLLSVKAKKLQLEIGLLDKKCKEARKLADKLTAKKAALGKAEERLEAIAPGAMPPAKKKISKKKSSKGIVDAVPAKKKTSPRRK